MKNSKFKTFKNIFHGRTDVYAKAWIEGAGKIKGFSPACHNRGKASVCKMKCFGCSHFKPISLSDKAIKNHLEGNVLLGIYPLLPGNTTKLLAADFDDHSSEGSERRKPFGDAKAYRKSAKALGLKAYMERSKSGKGFHVWIFFDEVVPAEKARRLGQIIIENSGVLKDGASFDRFFPSQDSSSGRGLGNLIALPFWGKVKKKGNSRFLNPNRQWQPYKKRTDFFHTVKFVHKASVDKILGKDKTDSKKEIVGEGYQSQVASPNWVVTALEGVTKGKRNTTVTRLTGYYIRKGLSQKEIESILSDWNNRNRPPLGEAELKQAIDSICSRASEESKSLNPFFDGKKFIPMSLSEHLAQERDLFHDGSGFYVYSADKGLWLSYQDEKIGQEMMNLLGDRAETRYINDAQNLLKLKVIKEDEKLNVNPLLINMENGVFDLSSMELIPHSKDYYFKYQLPIKYDPEAECPRWSQFLKEIFPDEPFKRRTVRDFAGYCLYPKIFIHKCLFCLGKGGNGKSILINIISKLVGIENTVALEPKQLEKEFQLATLKDKLLNISTEVDKKYMIGKSNWKKAIAGDTLQVDVKYKDPFSFRPIAKHLFSMNEVPNIPDRSDAFSRRFIVVNFNVMFEGEEEDGYLEDKLSLELSGIFNWALKGLKKVLETKKIYEAVETQSEKEDFLKASDPIRKFVQERCIKNGRSKVKKQFLFKAYEDWCEETEQWKLSKTQFYKKLLQENHDIYTKRPNGRAWYFMGIDLKDID